MKPIRLQIQRLGENIKKGQKDENGFWFSDDLSKWFGKPSSGARTAEYRRKKREGEFVAKRNHGIS